MVATNVLRFTCNLGLIYLLQKLFSPQTVSYAIADCRYFGILTGGDLKIDLQRFAIVIIQPGLPTSSHPRLSTSTHTAIIGQVVTYCTSDVASAVSVSAPSVWNSLS